MFLANTFIFMSTSLFELAVRAIFYAVYFGVVSRDMIDLVSGLLASNLGVCLVTVYCYHLIQLFSITAATDFPKSISNHSSAQFAEGALAANPNLLSMRLRAFSRVP
jgi:hypothetical protein